MKIATLWSEWAYLHFHCEGHCGLFTNVGNALVVGFNDFLYCDLQINLLHGCSI